MSYSTNKITSIADCDLLLALASKEKANLEFKKLSEERQKTTYSENSIEIEAELQSVNAEIAATETIINTLPDGTTKDDSEKKKTKLEYRKFILEDRRENYGVIPLLQQEMDLARLGHELTEVDTFIAAVSAHRATL